MVESKWNRHLFISLNDICSERKRFPKDRYVLMSHGTNWCESQMVEIDIARRMCENFYMFIWWVELVCTINKISLSYSFNVSIIFTDVISIWLLWKLIWQTNTSASVCWARVAQAQGECIDLYALWFIFQENKNARLATMEKQFALFLHNSYEPIKG